LHSAAKAHGFEEAAKSGRRNKMEKIKVRVTFLDEILGTLPDNGETYRDIILDKSPAFDREADMAELEAIEAVDEGNEPGTTVFPRDGDGKPCLYDYQVRGFFKGACAALSRADKSSASGKIKAYKKVIDGNVFVLPRMIPLEYEPDDEEGMRICARPLRAQTARGERIAIARSETVPPGASLEFEVTVLGDYAGAVREWLDYGRYSGIGQWRNSGKGRFEWEEIKTADCG
jgi:hypothetical protein